MKYLSVNLLLLSILATGPVLAGGFITGDSGGNERLVSVFDRNHGQIWQSITGVSGRFHRPGLDAGDYLVVCQEIITPVVVANDRGAEVLFTQQWPMQADCETWSPARKKFGQTFRARGPWVNGFTFWNPGQPQSMIAELRKDGPSGTLIGRFDFDNDPVHWIRIVDLEPGRWPTVPGDIYYLSVASTDGRRRFRMGTPALGDVYPDGQAWYDDQPMLDSDMGISISQDADNLTTTVRVTLHQGFGFKAEGPASGQTLWAAQSFLATTKNIRSVWLNAGWSPSEGIELPFVFSVHEESHQGKCIGPECLVRMIKDWGATAVWFADQVPVQPGKRYSVSFRRQDGKPFYAYLAPDLYDKGQAFRGGLDTPDMDLTCIVRGEESPGSVFLPYNIRTTELTATSAMIQWETAVAATTHLQFAPPEGHRAIISENKFTKQHRVKLKDLHPGVEYAYRVGGAAKGCPKHVLWSKIQRFESLSDPTVPDKPVGQAGAKKSIPLNNPSFEDGLEGWKKSSAIQDANAPSLPSGIGNASPLLYLGRYTAHSGRYVLGWEHLLGDRSGIVPRKIEPAANQVVYQTAETTPGSDYILSAWVCTDERQGGWNRNDRVRLVVDPTGSGKLDSTATVDEDHATQWYTTRGTWRRYRLKFTATQSSTDIGVQLYQWWILAENHIYVDDIELWELGPHSED